MHPHLGRFLSETRKGGEEISGGADCDFVQRISESCWSCFAPGAVRTRQAEEYSFDHLGLASVVCTSSLEMMAALTPGHSFVHST